MNPRPTRRAWLWKTSATWLVLLSFSVFAGNASAQGLTTAEAAAKVAAEHGVSPSDVVVTSINFLGSEQIGNVIYERYSIEARINGRSVVSGGAPTQGLDSQSGNGGNWGNDSWYNSDEELTDEEMIQESINFLNELYTDQLLGSGDEHESNSAEFESSSSYEANLNLDDSYPEELQYAERRAARIDAIASGVRVVLALLFLSSPFVVLTIFLVVRVIVIQCKQKPRTSIQAAVISDSVPGV